MRIRNGLKIIKQFQIAASNCEGKIMVPAEQEIVTRLLRAGWKDEIKANRHL
jgi:hypothetical protein